MSKLFISYSRENHVIVERLRQDLQQAGLGIWIDKIGLQPGTPDWDQALRDAIRDTDAVLLAASPHSRRSPYVGDEIALAKAAKKPIYPLWVEGEDWIDSVPLGLGRTQHLDLRGESYATNLPRLIGTLMGAAALPVVPDPTPPPVATPRNPYKGLRAFRAEDRGDFFGREALVDTLVSQIKPSARLLAVLGASGSGKSSVMMAGVLPVLQQQQPDWLFLDPMVPGSHPLEKLTIVLARQFKNKAQAAITDDLTDKSTRGLHRLGAELSDHPIVLYIDQFEEVFTLVEQETERRQFIDLLTTTITEPQGNLIVLLSMRADFYDRPAAYREFGTLIEKHHTLITPMTLADLYDVVQKPAQLPDVGLQFEDELVTEMIFVVREEAAALPLLQFTLDQLFQKREGNKLTLQAYHDIGGVQGALARHAESIYAGLPSPTHQKMARALFLRLIEAGQTEQDTTRRRASYRELTLQDAEQTRLLQETAAQFVDARLLVSDQTAETATLEVSHEALIRVWKRLGEWLHEAREDLRLQKSLAADVAEWLRRNKPEDRLYRGTVLRDAREWETRNLPSQDEAAFLTLSHEADTRRRQREARDARRLRYLGAALLVTLVFGALGLALIFARSNASLQDEATTLQAQAQTAEFQGAYVSAQVNWLSTRDFPLSFAQLTQTPAPAFLATATAQAELADWEPVMEVFDGIEMVLVPPGCFWMGSDAGDADETPVHEQCFEEAFWIDKYEVTQADFERLGGHKAADNRFAGEKRPVDTITWFEARDFCGQRGMRLPTEAEWEYAARGPENLIYPWGNEFEEDNAVFSENSDQSAEVGSKPEGASWVGTFNLSGNVYEWTSSLYRNYPYNESDEDTNDTNGPRVLRSGSWAKNSNSLRVANRYGDTPGTRNASYGFRCTRSFSE